MNDTRPLWTPDPARVASSRLTAFERYLGTTAGLALDDYPALHRFSTAEPARFWTAVWDFAGVRGDKGHEVVRDVDRLPGARFFPEGAINFTENVLRTAGPAMAVQAYTEAGPGRTLTRDDLAREVTQVARRLRAAGIGPGDRVCGIMANVPEAVTMALGAAAIGAVWSSCSPDFGVQGVLDRFGQIDPLVLCAVDGYRYGGKPFDCLEKLAAVCRELPGLRQVVVVPCLSDQPALARVPGAHGWHAWLAEADGTPFAWERFPFNHPLYVLYSSGTTGVPKCIIHGAGGTLLQHLKEHQLHCDVQPGDRVFYFTTCGWMMWNWLVTILASDASIVLYDGSPFHPDGHVLFDLADRAGVTLFGTSAKFIDAVAKAGLEPVRDHSLATVRTITSTGSPLSPESFDFVYRAIKADVHLASISGGTDIVSCFVGGDPTGPVWRGEIQVPGLGMDVDVFDPEGHPLADAAGELVCRNPFPSMPLGFWNDADGAKYHAAYFDRFPGVWCHGDWTRRTPHGGFIIYGRSDATLNPGGVRIGTAEIYRQVEQVPEVVESLAVGQAWEGDERIVLFVRLSPGTELDEALRARISRQIRTNTSPRHVPARIIPVADIPRTKSGKIVELAVRAVIEGRDVRQREALANPEALDLFRDLPALRS
ncbi:MAG TPA: acetoacetate--CoA ligase [Vicinamibacterales bacterium]|nr:acetoacetate--CoA ligase [Vicinamibacterales bacterium]